jgi:ribose transport system substrate-binding protein
MKVFKLGVLFLILGLVVPLGAFAGGEEEGVTGAEKEIVIGVSNGYFGNEWRTQDIEGIQKVFEFYRGKGMVADLIIQHAGGDINQQIQQSRVMINEGVDVLMINANSATGCNGVITEAEEAGIPVVSFDQAVTHPYVVNVTNNHYDWATELATWIAEELNGKGKVIVLNGLPGHPAAEERRRAALDVFGKYPDIEVLAAEYGFWDNSKAQQIMTDLLAGYPQVDGVWVGDTMATGVYNAFKFAGRDLPVMLADPMFGFFKKWKAELDSGVDYKAFCIANPPGVGATALGMAVYLAHGYELKPEVLAGEHNNTFYIPIRVSVTRDNLDQMLEEMKGSRDTLLLDDWLTDEEVRALFKGL